jgi:hypothetical protein
VGLTLTKYEIGDHYDGPGPGTSGPIIQYRVEGLPLEERAFIANFCVFPCDESWRVFHTKKGIDAHRDGDYKTADDALPFHHRLAYTERQMRHTSCLAALVALTAIALYAERLTIVDVVTMVQAKVPQDIIIQKIADCEPDFDLRPGALAASARSRALRSGNGKTASLPVNIAMAGRNTRASGREKSRATFQRPCPWRVLTMVSGAGIWSG